MIKWRFMFMFLNNQKTSVQLALLFISCLLYSPHPFPCLKQRCSCLLYSPHLPRLMLSLKEASCLPPHASLRFFWFLSVWQLIFAEFGFSIGLAADDYNFWFPPKKICQVFFWVAWNDKNGFYRFGSWWL